MSRSRDIPRLPATPKKRIPYGATEIDPKVELDQLVSFHFSMYNQKLCEIKDLDAAKARGVLESMRKAGGALPQSLMDAGVTVKDVAGSNDYAKLYNGLDDSVQLKEIICTNTARVIYFSVESRFYIRAILSAHLETTKIRRGKKRKHRKK